MGPWYVLLVILTAPGEETNAFADIHTRVSAQIRQKRFFVLSNLLRFLSIPSDCWLFA